MSGPLAFGPPPEPLAVARTLSWKTPISSNSSFGQALEERGVDAVESRLIQGRIVVPYGGHAVAIALLIPKAAHQSEHPRQRSAFIGDPLPLLGRSDPGIDVHEWEVLDPGHQAAKFRRAQKPTDVGRCDPVERHRGQSRQGKGGYLLGEK